MDQNHLNRLSEQLLLNVKMQKDTLEIRLELEQADPKMLASNLANDDKKKAFWINIYNAYYQILRAEKNVQKPDIYKKQLFSITGQSLSLDDVEHGILRRYRYKYSLGFFATLFPAKFIKEHAVDVLDYRIHFALNCGAKSCPPIAFYNPNEIDELLDLATQSFLVGESEFNDAEKTVSTTTLFKWFYADFGRTKGIRKIFKKQLDKDISDYKIIYNPYSWEDDLSNFAPDVS
jgi:hypothetical protein